MKIKILIIEDEPSMRLGMGHLLSSSGYMVKTCSDGGEGITAIRKERFDIVITDLKLPKYDGLAILKHVKTTAPDTSVIIMTAYAEVKNAVQAIKDGAFDYLAKPFSNEELLITIERLVKFRNLEIELNCLRESLSEKIGCQNMLGTSPSMQDVFDRITAIADADVSVLILGESGTGKELVANAIHNLSSRRERPFIKINCAAIPENLFESELFGHERGAYTGASETKKGKFEIADGGSLFLDEIGDMPIGLQPKLLRVIEDQSITRLGGNENIKVDVRGIYATTNNLKEIIKTGRFREDLFYRINGVPIVVPPLRDRKDDIAGLIDHFLRHFSGKYAKSDLKLTPSAYEAMMAYGYPGNVRQLKHAIEQAVLLSKNGAIDIRCLPEEFSGGADRAPCVKEDLSLDESVRCFEKQRILIALTESEGKKIEAAKRLGISRKVLWKKLKDYGVE